MFKDKTKPPLLCKVFNNVLLFILPLMLYLNSIFISCQCIQWTYLIKFLLTNRKKEKEKEEYSGISRGEFLC